MAERNNPTPEGRKLGDQLARLTEKCVAIEFKCPASEFTARAIAAIWLRMKEKK